jgi:UDP-N-acetylmuramyl tripeptide synthase
VFATDIQLHGTRNAAFELHTPAGATPIELPLPGLYNVYNALAATSLCLALDEPLKTIADGLASVSAAFGRAERVQIGECELSILLVKNPAGANEILRTLALEDGELDVLAVLNDRTADGRDVSWVWDADFEMLAGHARRVTCAGTRAAELALRLKYAGVEAERLTVVPALPAALDAALADCPARRLFAVPTYTALLELRHELERRGHVSAFWSRPPAAVMT